jgi:TetR/AcrR family transcriptional repressor of nem operon
VRKGTFYHFLDSKADLARAGVQKWWDDRRERVERMFRPEVPPLDRICAYLDFVGHEQLLAHKECGKMLGGPLFTLASEICMQEEELLVSIRDILHIISGLFEAAVHEAWRAGQVEGNDPANKARLLWAFYEGTLTQARIENNPDRIRALTANALEVLGARNPSPASLVPEMHLNMPPSPSLPYSKP